MNPDAEAALEEATLVLFAELGWQVQDCYHEVVGQNATIGRASRNEVILRTRLRAALERLNPTLPATVLDSAIAEIGRDRSLLTPARANQELYHLLKDGVKVTYRTADGDDRVESVRVVDWGDPDNNDFFLAQ